ncbi:hypothetical protein C5167_022360 [Papaver somniferum]|uniref:Uncharacterized protein n=1 Tax=Papaver somniferum TaxID=3469 RepID=A0A4Y7JLP9_PAPSO|nr:hypothetical protein C5167_022360 [Papaver somniferum]
MDSTGAEDPLE